MITERIRNFLNKKKELHPDEKKKLTNLENEIARCLSYLELTNKNAYIRVTHSKDGESDKIVFYESMTKAKKEEIDKKVPRLVSIHIKKYTVGYIGGGYFWQSDDNISHIIGNEIIPQAQIEDIVQEINNVTFSYANKVRNRRKNK